MIKHKIYDVTEFLQQHPAGIESIVKYSGMEASRHFHFHSQQAQKIWNIILKNDGCIILIDL